MLIVAVILLKGLLGIPTNVREGITWLKRAAESANEEAPQALNVLVSPGRWQVS